MSATANGRPDHAGLVVEDLSRWGDPALGTSGSTLHGIGLTLSPGEVLGVAGDERDTSTLLRSLFGTYRPDGGRVLLRVGGRELDLSASGSRAVTWARRRWLRLDEGELVALPNRSVADILDGERRGGRTTHGDAAEELRRVGVKRDPRTPIGLLEHGERRRLGLLHALLHPARILLLSDPLGALAATEADNVRELVAAARASGSAILATGFDPVELSTLGSRVRLLEEGTLR